MISRTLVKYVLTAALRDRLIATLALMVVLATAVSMLLGAATTTEGERFALVFGAGALRLLGMMGVVLFCCFYVRRSFEAKEVEFLLSRPISRLCFLLSHTAAFAVLALGIALAATLAVALLGRPDLAGLAVWGGSLFVEFSLMAVTALFFSMVLSSAAGSALAAFGVYALARAIGVVIGIVSKGPENPLFAAAGSVIKLISIVVPRLDLMGQTSWLVYGVKQAVGVKFLPDAGAYALWMAEHLGLTGLIAAQGVVFLALLLAASAHDFARRQF